MSGLRTKSYKKQRSLYIKEEYQILIEEADKFLTKQSNINSFTDLVMVSLIEFLKDKNSCVNAMYNYKEKTL